MQKRFALIVLLVALTIPVGAQRSDFLASLMKAVIEEFGIEQVISVLEDLGYIGESEVAVQDAAIVPDDLTVNHEIWELPDDELVDVLISRMNDPGNEDCWTYLELGTSESLSAQTRMGYRARFIDTCMAQ